MSNRTFKVIVFLVILLFINIEAAQAGLVHRLKLFIQNEFSDFQLFYISGGTLVVAVLLCIIAMPVHIGKEKRIWFTDIDVSGAHDYRSRRMAVKRISNILTSPSTAARAENT